MAATQHPTNTATAWRGLAMNGNLRDYYVDANGTAHGDLFCSAVHGTSAQCTWTTTTWDERPDELCPSCGAAALAPLAKGSLHGTPEGPSLDAPQRGDGQGTGNGSSGTRRATEKQVAFIASLLDRLPEATAKGMLSSRPEALPVAEASALIDELQAAVKALGSTAAPAAKAQAARPNRYAGACHLCGGHVAAEAGVLAGKDQATGRWLTAHRAGECPEGSTAAPAAAKAQAEVEPGMYRLADGTMVRAYNGRSGRVLAKKVVGTPETGYEFEYLGMAHRFVAPEQRLTLAEAQAWGRQTSSCCVCTQHLEDPESVAAGIGPVCASRV